MAEPPALDPFLYIEGLHPRVPSMKISARNQLSGTVESVNTDPVMAEVIVKLKGGERIVSAITTQSAKRLNLAPGKSVVVFVKSTEVMLGVED